MAGEATAEVRLADLTTLRLGGPPERLLQIADEAELVEVVRTADQAGEPILVLAGGSNVVVADDGFAGTVAHVASQGVERRELADGRVELTAQAGVDWDALVAATAADALVGLECLSGIPGATGATPIQNVGAYGQDVAQTITSVRALERATGEIVELTNADCGFEYRTSRFKHRETHVILSVTFALQRSEAELSAPIRYAELARRLGVELGARAPLAEVREAVLELRRGKGMVVDPADPDSVSAGSFFTNPVLDAQQLAELERRAAKRTEAGDSVPAWPQPDGRTKTSAAWLIERSGFHRGYGEGRVGLSAKHTLAIVNRGGATTAELVALAREIAGGVREAFGVELTPEPVFVGHEW